ncbi:unknown [Anaerotruncus sp. CAG:390]|nr:unknown [Anaerotruncus sp. CAG:390]
MIFLRNLIFLPTPPSFVKFNASVSGVMTGSSVSVPSSDHVPELMYTNFSSFFAGTASTADAVSWDAMLTTSAPQPPTSAPTSPRTFPSDVPG